MTRELQDFGEFDGDVLAFGGVCSNVHALTALMQVAAERGWSANRTVCTGDLAAYCASPAEVVDAIRTRGIAAIKGNCEESLAADAEDCGCGFAEGSACDRLSAAWYSHARRTLDSSARDWMATLPKLAVFRAHGARWGVLHGGATSVNRFLWPTSEEALFVEEIAAFEAKAGPVDAILAGHCGLPFLRVVGGRRWFNTGALGMPPNDGDPRTSYGIITRDGPIIERLAYDKQAAAETMKAVNLTQGYDRALLTGRWPSQEILPTELRRPGEN